MACKRQRLDLVAVHSTTIDPLLQGFLAERERFELSLRFPVNSISSAASSTTRAPLRVFAPTSFPDTSSSTGVHRAIRIADKACNDNVTGLSCGYLNVFGHLPALATGSLTFPTVP